MRYAVLLVVLFMTGCASTLRVPAAGTDFTLDWCTPLLNCVSTSSRVFLYQVDPIKLTGPLDAESWQVIKSVATELPGASLNEARFGYLDITCFSNVFYFPDYLEILISDDQKSLGIRSQSQLGLYDFGVNRRRVEAFRQALVERGIAEIAEQP
jgi:uncharacterized protein (DUF1499 family)